ncbi:unnamed protein product [Mytilus coruscus]|uniref:SGNH hydrolase-type esterase domain-containing protein n=1 Tax=Mytilus coruscus TaxID=42192 RepID=A0A6J8CJU8_MYTCO|nr:unnamed protein product [Mytilus coruscus]
MDLTSTFFKNITSFLGDFSGFKSVSEDFDFLKSKDNENTISNINQIGSTQNSNVSETNPKVVQYMTSDCVETESKLAHSMTSINTDTVITSTPSRQSPDTNELLLDFNTLSPININHHKSVNLQEEIFELKKLINTKDLNNTSVSTNKGARIVDIINIVKDKDIRQYESIIVHIGGNDISNGATLNLIQENYESLLYLLRSKADMNTNIIVSSVPPRKDVDVEPVNKILIDLCDYYNLQYIDHSKCFYDDYGYVKKTLFQRDGIHLTKIGTMVFLQNIDQYVKILKLSSNNDYCQYCGERGHDLNTCRHGKPVSCFSCKSFGHKEKFCDLYWS